MILRTLKKIIATGLLSFALSLSAQNPNETANVPSEFVYIQQAYEGELIQNEQGIYQLKLKGNSLNLVYFTDQPARTTGQKDLSHFFNSEGWQKKGKIKHPTAFVNYTDFQPSDQKEAVAPDILELSDPTYDAESDTLTLTVKPLHEHPIQVGQLKNVVMVYDTE